MLTLSQDMGTIQGGHSQHARGNKLHARSCNGSGLMWTVCFASQYDVHLSAYARALSRTLTRSLAHTLKRVLIRMHTRSHVRPHRQRFPRRRARQIDT